MKTHHRDGQSPAEKRRNIRTSSTSHSSTPSTVSVSPSLVSEVTSAHSKNNTETQGITTPSQAYSGLPAEQPAPGQLLPGTGFYVPSTSAGSISCGTPMTNVNQYLIKTPDSNVAKQQENTHLDQAQVQMAQDFLNNAERAYLYQDFYYNS